MESVEDGLENGTAFSVVAALRRLRNCGGQELCFRRWTTRRVSGSSTAACSATLFSAAITPSSGSAPRYPRRLYQLMIKQPARERKCLLPLISIAVGYCHAEERDVVTGTAQCPCPDMLPAYDAGIPETRISAQLVLVVPSQCFIHGGHLGG
jgi:hypothetical protein